MSVASDKEENECFKAQLHECWVISDLGEAKFCLGIAIKHKRSTRSIFLSQHALINQVVAKFGLTDAHPVSILMDPSLKLSCNIDAPASKEDAQCLQAIPYHALIGSLMYIAMGTHPDIAFMVQQLSQYLDCYGLTHWDAAKYVVHYLKGTQSLWLQLGGTSVMDLVGYMDSNYANCVDTCRSISRYSFSLGTGLVSWSAHKQKTVSTSSCKSEYYC